MADRIRRVATRWPTVSRMVWVALVMGAFFATVYACLYGPLAILGYFAAPLAVLAAFLSVLRGERGEPVVVLAAGTSLAPVLSWWVFGCVVGGFVGGLGYVAGFVGELVLFGGVLGLAQWIMLRRYLRYAGFWVVVSFFGWIVAQVAVISVQDAFPGLVNAAHEVTRDDVFAYALFDPIVWMIYGMVQGIVLLAVLRSSAPPWLLPWIVASASGGVFEAASVYLNLHALLGGWGDGFATMLFIATYQGVICGLYGILTGLVLYGALRQSVTVRPAEGRA